MENMIVCDTEFSPKIKLYFLLYVAFFLFVSFIGIPFLIIWFLGLGQYMSRRYYENLDCRLTNRHLEFKKGVIFKVEKTIPLENIQDLTFLSNPLLNWLDLRILKVETAGNSNPQGSDMKLVGIVGAHEFNERVMDQRDLLVDSKGSAIQSSSSEESLLVEIRDLLKEIRDQKK